MRPMPMSAPLLPTPQETPPAAGSTAAWAAARALASAFARGNVAVRERVVVGLLRPLSPLAVAAVASGAFAVHLARPDMAGSSWSRFRGDLAAHTPAQVYELARFTEEVDPHVLAELLLTLGPGPITAARRTALPDL